MHSQARVHTLRLRAPDEALVRRGAILVEDALRTASVPDGGGRRVLVVRHLALGRVHPDRSPAHIALTIEQRLWQLGVDAVYAGDPGAATAPAVFFHDAIDAHAALARCVARGDRPSAWYWRLAVPAWQASETRPDALRTILASILSTESGLAAAAAFVDDLARSGCIEPLLSALDRDDGPRLLTRCGWSLPPEAASAGHSNRAPLWADVPPLLGDPIRRWVLRWGPTDARSVWLAAISLVAQIPARILDPGLVRRAAQFVERAVEASLPGADHRSAAPQAPAVADARHHEAAESSISAPVSRLQLQTPGRAPVAQPGKESGRVEVAGADTPRATPASRSIDAAPVPADHPENLAQTRAQDRSDGACATAYAGLFFLLQVMSRLKMADFLIAHPALIDGDLPGRVLQAIADRLEIPADDPVRASLKGPLTRRPIRSGVQLSDAWIHLLVSAWVVAVRRWCRRIAKTGLRSLVCRPGRVAWTRAYLDVTVDMQHADVRVRRAGLDLDPGWLPWFGGVVRFHYVRGETL